MTTTGCLTISPRLRLDGRLRRTLRRFAYRDPPGIKLVGRWLISTSWYRRIIRFGWW
jgi:hypothetical protein